MKQGHHLQARKRDLTRTQNLLNPDLGLPGFRTLKNILLLLKPTSLSHVADRVFVLWPGVRPVTLRWESRVQDIGPPQTSWLHVLSNGKRSPRDLHLKAKTQLHSTTNKLQCWTSYAKQLAREEYNPTH